MSKLIISAIISAASLVGIGSDTAPAGDATPVTACTYWADGSSACTYWADEVTTECTYWADGSSACVWHRN